jgi:light-regulated signal transduction histidine kinase (bacteriophytochrome)
LPRSAAAENDLRCAEVEEELQAFSYIVSHDLSGAFRHVSAFSRLLLAETDQVGTARQRTHAEYVHRAAERCQLMLDQLLAYSRVQQKPLSPAWHDATTSVELALMRLGAADSANVQVSIEPLGEVYADAKLLALAFGHLIGNAVKFRSPGARPRIAVRPAHDAKAWRVRISDNGLGVDVAHRELAFQMFKCLNREDAFAGVGAGLAICRRIAYRHGGDVCFLDCDAGACVELTLPRSEARSRDPDLRGSA